MSRSSTNNLSIGNKIPVNQYKNLKSGTKYIFKTFWENNTKIREGLLMNVSTTWDIKTDEKGKETKRTLVGNVLQFEPLGEAAWTEYKGEKLKVFSTTIYRGSFEIFEVKEN